MQNPPLNTLIFNRYIGCDYQLKGRMQRRKQNEFALFLFVNNGSPTEKKKFIIFSKGEQTMNMWEC